MRIAPLLLATIPALVQAQGTAADYKRADELNRRYGGLAVDVAETPHWIGSSGRVWYRKSVAGGNVFVVADAVTKTKKPAFDHARLAAALSSDSVRATPTSLPFTAFEYIENEGAIGFTSGGFIWRCGLTDYKCAKTGPAPANGRGRGGSPEADDDAPYEGPSPLEVEAMEESRAVFQPGGRGNGRADLPRLSPDGTNEAFVDGYNVAIRTVSASGRGLNVRLSTDGSATSPYVLTSIRWSPDSKKLMAYRLTLGTQRRIYYVLSSPPDQLQPKLDSTNPRTLYQKPGDTVDLAQPELFDVASRTPIPIDRTLFPNPYRLSNFSWRSDSHAFTFEDNERGHQDYRVIEVNASNGAARMIINEHSPTFIYYNPTDSTLSSGKHYRFDVADGKEIIWMSERDGWNHLYLYDGTTGAVKNQITKGNWVVRYVTRVDIEKRQVYFAGNGMSAGEDPYLLHHYRINFDGTGLTSLTPAAGNHSIAWSADGKFYTDTYSQVNAPPLTEIRRAADQSLVMTVEKPDLSALTATGWAPPEVFVSKARDGTTDIWGVIFRPSNFDSTKKYPVIENIYAGPQGSFVPKTFSVNNGMRNLAELGFIVVQIDGMGTSNRSKAFHDVAFMNLADAGFADRILWHKAVAARYSSYDITRVGIYGTSAGGQNSLAGLLFHPEFYKVGFSAAGCHDNRMDKIWWNEQWMGWPIGPQYAASSNTVNAARLQGKLMLVVGEYDTNVDPSSTIQVVNALIKANKTFDLLYIPNADHGSGGAYGERKRNDFFVHNLLGVEAPDRNTGNTGGAPARPGGN